MTEWKMLKQLNATVLVGVQKEGKLASASDEAYSRSQHC